MTNLEMLIKSDSYVRQTVIEAITMEICIDPVKMKRNTACKCEKCVFADLSGKYPTCDENKIMEWLQHEQNVAEIAKVDKGTGAIVGEEPKECPNIERKKKMNYSSRIMSIQLFRNWMDEVYRKEGVRPLDNYETFLAFLSLKGFLKEGEKKDE